MPSSKTVEVTIPYDDYKVLKYLGDGSLIKGIRLLLDNYTNVPMIQEKLKELTVN